MNADNFDELFTEQPDLRISSAARDQHLRLLDHLAQGRRTHTRWWRKWAVILAASLGLGAAGLGTAAAFGAFSAPTDRRIAYCFTTADLNDPANREEFTVATAPNDTNPSLRDAAASALDICAGGWQQGRFSATNPKISLDPKPAPWNYPVPPLVACVLPNGSVGVFPGDTTTCASLGLPTAML